MFQPFRPQICFRYHFPGLGSLRSPAPWALFLQPFGPLKGWLMIVAKVTWRARHEKLTKEERSAQCNRRHNYKYINTCTEHQKTNLKTSASWRPWRFSYIHRYRITGDTIRLSSPSGHVPVIHIPNVGTLVFPQVVHDCSDRRYTTVPTDGTRLFSQVERDRTICDTAKIGKVMKTMRSHKGKFSGGI